MQILKEKKALLAEKGKSTWDESSSSEKEEEETVKCLMADDDQVFDFSSDEFSKDDLVNALNDMVIEYKKLSDSFKDLKSDSKDFSKQTNETEVLKNRVFELSVENEKLKAIVQSLSFENNRLNYIFKSWTQSGIAL